MALRDLLININARFDRRPVDEADRATDELGDSANRAGRQFDRLADRINRLGERANRLGGELQSAGSDFAAPFLAGGAAIGAGLGLAVKTAADFEQAMDRVGALSGATEKEVSKLTDTARMLGETTSFSASQAAEGMSYLAMAGYKSNEVIDAMPGLLSMAAAGQTELGETADIASNILSGFGLEASETARVADILTKTFTSSNTDLSMLGYTMKYVAPVAKAAGQSLESMSAAAGILGNAGIQADSAGTALRMMLIRLAKPPKMARDALDDLGISVSDQNGNMKDLSQIIGEMADKTKDMTEAERLAAVAKISGTEASAAMLALMDAGQASMESFTKELEGAGGTADRIATQQLDNLNGRLTILKSGIEAVAITMGNYLIPYFNKAAGFAQNLVDKFNALPDSQKKMITIGLALAAALMLLVGGLGMLVVFAGLVISSFGSFMTLVSGVGTLISGLGGLSGAIGLLTGPVGLTVLAIVGLGAAFIALWRKSETFRANVIGIFNRIKEAVTTAFGIVASFVGEKIAQIKQFWDSNGAQILTAVENVFNGIMAVIDFVMPAVLFIIKMVWTAIKQVINGALNVIMGVIKVFSGLFTGDFGKMWEGIKQIFFGAIDLVVGWMSLTFIGGLRRIFTNLLTFAVNIVRNLWTGIVNLFRSFSSTGVNIANGLVSRVLGFFRNLYNSASSIFTMLRNFGASIWNALKQTVVSIAQSIWRITVQRFTSMVNSIRNIFSTVKNTISSIWGGVMDFFRGINLKEIGKNIIQGLINGIGSMASSLVDKVKGVVDNAIEGAKNLLGINSPSRVFMEFGEFTGEGYNVGLERMMKPTENTMAAFTQTAIQSFESPVDSLTSKETQPFDPIAGYSPSSTTTNQNVQGGDTYIELYVEVPEGATKEDGEEVGDSIVDKLEEFFGGLNRRMPTPQEL